MRSKSSPSDRFRRSIAHPCFEALDADITALIEILGRHVHEVWMKLRAAEGWTYGARRDDDRREHPCLVAYDDLPDSQKEYDRQMALATLRAVVALGYTIIKEPD